MKRLYKTVVEYDGNPDESAVATAEAIAAIEETLGAALPKTYKQFALQVGSASWPVTIYALDALVSPVPADARPTYLLAFATDNFGNEWCFDTRTLHEHEYPIVFWDHEAPLATEQFEDQPQTTFDHWLRDLVDEKLAEDDEDAVADRRNRIEAALEVHREGNRWPWAPSDEDVRVTEQILGFALPKDYVWFTTTLGSTNWPFTICDVVDMRALTNDMNRIIGRSTSPVAAFGRDEDGCILGFQKGGKLVAGSGVLHDRSFFDFLERRIKEKA